MTGVPMVATSPMRHDLPPTTPNPLNPVEIQGYEPPWKALCDFALNSDLDRPGYNHLVNEVSFFFFLRPLGRLVGGVHASRLIALRAQHNKNPRQCPGTNIFLGSLSFSAWIVPRILCRQGKWSVVTAFGNYWNNCHCRYATHEITVCFLQQLALGGLHFGFHRNEISDGNM